MELQWKPRAVFADLASGQVDSVCAAYGDLLRQGQVARFEASEQFGMWGIFSHAEVQKAAQDPATFSSNTVPPGSPRILPLMADPPEHSGYRRLVNRFFGAGPIAEIETQVRPVAGEMVEEMIGKGGGDYAVDYAYPFAIRGLCKFLRVETDWRIFNDWSHKMEELTGAGTAAPGSKLPMEHINAVVPYIQELVTTRRANPGNDIVSGIVTGELNGEKLDDQAVVSLVMTLIIAGHATTASAIGNFVLRLARDQSLQGFLRAHPERISDAMEECLRIDTPQQEQPRIATRDVEVAGQLIRAGESVFVNFGSANVDPQRWEDPCRFDIDRPQKTHFAFGRGIHSCFGAPLGRMEIKVSVEELLARTRSFDLVGDIARNTWPRLSVERLPLKLVLR